MGSRFLARQPREDVKTASRGTNRLHLLMNRILFSSFSSQGAGTARTDGRGAEADPGGWPQCVVAQRGVAAPRREHVVPGELQPGGGGTDAGRHADRHIPDTGEECRSLRAVHIEQRVHVPLHSVWGREWVWIRGALQRPWVVEGARDALPEELAGGAQ